MIPRRLPLLLMLPLLLAAEPKADLKDFTSKEGRFKIAFTEEPKENSNTVKTPNGDLTIYSFTVLTADGIRVVGYFDVPEAALKAVKPDELLDRARDGSIKNVGGTLGSEKKIMLDNTHPGREYDATFDGNKTLRCRMFLVKDRVYQVFVGGGKDFADGKESIQFFESFQLIK